MSKGLSGNPIAPLQRVSLNSALTNVVLDSDSGDSSLVIRTGTSNSLYIDKYSNVGINISSPGAQLEIASATGSCVRLRYGSSSTAFSNISIASSGNLTISPNSGSMEINSAVSVSGNQTVSGTLTIGGGGSIASTLNVIDAQGIGTAIASKALIVDSSKSIAGINSIGATSLTLGSTTLSASDAVCFSQLTPGAAANGKALVMDNSGSVSGINSLSATSLSGTLQTNLQPKVTQVGTLTSLQVSGAVTFTSATDAASTTSGGALNVSGGMAVAKSVFIGGNIVVSGSTTSVNSSSISIKDNTLVLNASPTGLTDSGILVSRFQTSNDSATGSVIADSAFLTTTATAGTTATVTLASDSSQDNYYQGWWMMVNGAQVRQVASYVGSSRVATVEFAFTITPLNGQTVKLYNRSFASFIWNETAK